MINIKVGFINFTNASIPIIFDDDMYYNRIPEEHKSSSLGDSIHGPAVEECIDFFKTIQLKYNFFNIPIISKTASIYNQKILDLFTAKKISSWGNIELTLNNYESTISTSKGIKGNAIIESSIPDNPYNFNKFPAIATYAGTDILDFFVRIWFTVLPEKCWSNDNTLDLSELSEIVYVQHALGNTVQAQQNYAIIKTIFYTKSINIYGISELNGVSIKYPVNLYANPTGYEVNNGETVTPNFVMVYSDDTIEEPYTNITYDESRYFKDTISTLDEDGISITIAPDNTIKRLDYIVRPNVESEANLFATFHIDVLDAKNPYFPDGDSTTGGGNGGYGSNESYFGTSGLIPNGTVESNDSVGSMYTRYAMNLTDLNTIGNYFWSEDLGLQVAKTIISLLYGDPVQTIISCVSYPFNIASLTGISGRGLRWGGHDTGLTMQALNSNAFQIDWGTITVNEYWGNFLDYSPFTKFQLYLPWGTGFVDIDPNDVMRAKGGIGTTAGGSGTLSVKTNVEVSRGMCVHHVIANDTVIGSYSGSCGRQIPITGSDYASKQVAIAGAAVGAMTSAAIGVGSAIREHSRGNWAESATGAVHTRGPLGTRRNYDWSVTPQQAAGHGARVAANASRPAIAAAASVMVSPPHVSRSGSFQEGTGSLTIQSPYLIISRPRMSMPANYGNLYGYPSNIYLNLGSLSGYTEVGSIHLDGIPATMEELSEIDDLLKGGVIL